MYEREVNGNKKRYLYFMSTRKKLNLEHVPPQGVGNKGGKNTLTGDLNDFLSWVFSEKSLPREIKRQPRGNAYYTLCIDCNSKLGGAGSVAKFENQTSPL